MSTETVTPRVVHFRIACDAPPVVGHGFRIDDTHEKRLRKAAYLYGDTIRLDPDACSFGPKRLILEGEFDYEAPSHSWIRPKPAQQGFALAVTIAQWTLKMLYGASDLPHNADEPPNCRVDIRVRETTAA